MRVIEGGWFAGLEWRLDNGVGLCWCWDNGIDRAGQGFVPLCVLTLPILMKIRLDVRNR